MPQPGGSFDPRSFEQLTFHDRVRSFHEGKETPRDYLERCLATIGERESIVQGWESLRVEGARADADASAARYGEGRPLSSIDGMPFGVKDLIQTRDLPTTMGIRDNPNRTGVDSPSVSALRAAGAVLVGKATTTEMGGADPSKTTNPFDPSRTPGGSSSGSAAVVGARMVPVALGTQVGGSLIRPAAYCANFAIRPTFGGLNRGERLGSSHGVLGVHAGSLVDMWWATIEIAKRAGGDPGYPGVFGGDDPMPARQPQRVILVETGGWGEVDETTRGALADVIAQLERSGVAVLRRGDDAQIESFEQILAEAQEIAVGIIGWENRWIFEHLAEAFRGRLRTTTMAMLEHSRSISLDRYRSLLVRRDEARRRFAAIGPLGDALLTLSAPGPAPAFEPPDQPDPRVPYGTTGSASFNFGTSILGAPAATLPVISRRRHAGRRPGHRTASRRQSRHRCRRLAGRERRPGRRYGVSGRRTSRGCGTRPRVAGLRTGAARRRAVVGVRRGATADRSFTNRGGDQPMKTNRRRTRRSTRVSLAAVALLVAACGGDDDDEAASSEVTSPAATSAPDSGGTAASTAAVAPGTTGAPGTSGAPETTGGEQPQAGGTLHLITYTEGPNWLPESHTANTPTHDLVFDRLYDIDAEGNIYPGLAESLTEESDGTWTLVLNEGIEFSDETPFNSEAITSYWDLVSGDEANPCHTSLSAAVESWEAVDDLTVSMTPAPQAALLFPWVLAGANAGGTASGGCVSTIGSPTARESAGADFQSKPVGAGPYLLESWVPLDSMAFVRNPNYWQEGKPYIDRVEVKYIGDSQQRCDTFLSGGYEVVWMGTAQPCMGQLSDAGAEVLRASLVGGIGLGFGLNKAPTDDARVRQAIAYAMDLDDINEKAVGGQTDMAEYFIPEDSPFFVDMPSPVGDLDKAQALIDEYVAETGGPVRLDFLLAVPVKNFNDVQIQQISRLNNVEVNSIVVEGAAITQALLEKNYNVGSLQFAGLTPDLTFAQYASNSSPVSQYANPEMDSLIVEAASTDDVEAKKALYEQMLTLIFEDMPGIPLWRADRPTFVDPNAVHGYAIRPGSLFGVRWDELWLTD